MNNQTINEKINNYFTNNTVVEKTVKAYMLNMLANFSSKKLNAYRLKIIH